jgi:hypothetical protein
MDKPVNRPRLHQRPRLSEPENKRPRLRDPYVYADKRLAREMVTAARELAKVIGIRKAYYAVQHLADNMARDCVEAEEKTSG